MKSLVDAARSRLAQGLGAPDIEDIASRFAVQTMAHNRVQLGRQLEAGLGTNVLGGTLGPSATDHHIVSAFVDSNVALIKGLGDQLAADVSSEIFRAIQDGKTFNEIGGQLTERFGMAERRATLIGRDQIGKLYGQVNVMRQKQLGVEKFIWTTVGDDRVRDEHAERDGQTYSYADPPDGELPGEPVLCRCWADPVLEDLSDDDSEDTADDDQGDDSSDSSGDGSAESTAPAPAATPPDQPADLEATLEGLVSEQEAVQELHESMGLGRIGVSSEVAGEAEVAEAEAGAGSQAGIGFERVGVGGEIAGEQAAAVAAPVAPVPQPVATEPAALKLEPSAMPAPLGWSSYTYGDETYWQHATGDGVLLTPAQYKAYQAGDAVTLTGPNRQFAGFEAIAIKGHGTRYRTLEWVGGQKPTFALEQVASGKAQADIAWHEAHELAQQAKPRRGLLSRLVRGR